MTAKETADKIFMQHYMVLFDSESDKGNEVLVTSLAKQSALIDVQNTIDNLTNSSRTTYKGKSRVSIFENWQKVKSELEKI